MVENEKNEGTPTSPEIETTSVAPSADVASVQEDTAPNEETAAAETVSEEQSETALDATPAVPRRIGVNPNTTMEKPFRRPLPEGAKVELHNSIAIIGADIEELNKLSETYRNLDVGRSKEALNWMASIQGGQSALMNGNAFLDTVSRPEADFRQSVSGEGGIRLAAGRPNFGESTETGGRLTGVQAMMKIKGLLGLGTIARVPLWHSGLWVSFKAPSEAELLELDRRIANEKIILGRATNGMIFSNTSVYLNSYLMNFALANVYEATYRQVPPMELKERILITDLPQLIWGLLCTIYPNGYQYRQPCVNDPSTCTHVVEELLDLTKLSWTNDRAFTAEQRKHMSRRTAKFTDEEIKAYQSAFGFNDKYGTVKIHDKITMVLQVPTLAEYERRGFEWVDGIVERVDKAFGGQLLDAERNRYIIEQGHATALRQYGQWVKMLVIEDGQGVVDDPATIEEIISDFTSHPEVYKNFFDAIEKFINNTTVSLIALPKFKCPKCEAPMTNEETLHPYLVPLDISSIFFTLLDQRVHQMLQQ